MNTESLLGSSSSSPPSSRYPFLLGVISYILSYIFIPLQFGVGGSEDNPSVFYSLHIALQFLLTTLALLLLRNRIPEALQKLEECKFVVLSLLFLLLINITNFILALYFSERITYYLLVLIDDALIYIFQLSLYRAADFTRSQACLLRGMHFIFLIFALVCLILAKEIAPEYRQSIIELIYIVVIEILAFAMLHVIVGNHNSSAIQGDGKSDHNSSSIQSDDSRDPPKQIVPERAATVRSVVIVYLAEMCLMLLVRFIVADYHIFQVDGSTLFLSLSLSQLLFALTCLAIVAQRCVYDVTHIVVSAHMQYCAVPFGVLCLVAIALPLAADNPLGFIDSLASACGYLVLLLAYGIENVQFSKRTGVLITSLHIALTAIALLVNIWGYENYKNGDEEDYDGEYDTTAEEIVRFLNLIRTVFTGIYLMELLHMIDHKIAHPSNNDVALQAKSHA